MALFAVLAALCWLLVGLAVPFYLPIIYIILAVWGLVLWIADGKFPTAFLVVGGIAAGLTLPLFAYYAYAFSANPILAFGQPKIICGHRTPCIMSLPMVYW